MKSDKMNSRLKKEGEESVGQNSVPLYREIERERRGEKEREREREREREIRVQMEQ